MNSIYSAISVAHTISSLPTICRRKCSRLVFKVRGGNSKAPWVLSLRRSAATSSVVPVTSVFQLQAYKSTQPYSTSLPIFLVWLITITTVPSSSGTCYLTSSPVIQIPLLEKNICTSPLGSFQSHLRPCEQLLLLLSLFANQNGPVAKTIRLIEVRRLGN
jgi:hypothetical protein